MNEEELKILSELYGYELILEDEQNNISKKKKSESFHFLVSLLPQTSGGNLVLNVQLVVKFLPFFLESLKEVLAFAKTQRQNHISIHFAFGFRKIFPQLVHEHLFCLFLDDQLSTKKKTLIESVAEQYEWMQQNIPNKTKKKKKPNSKIIDLTSSSSSSLSNTTNNAILKEPTTAAITKKFGLKCHPSPYIFVGKLPEAVKSADFVEYFSEVQNLQAEFDVALHMAPHSSTPAHAFVCFASIEIAKQALQLVMETGKKLLNKTVFADYARGPACTKICIEFGAVPPRSGVSNWGRALQERLNSFGQLQAFQLNGNYGYAVFRELENVRILMNKMGKPGYNIHGRVIKVTFDVNEQKQVELLKRKKKHIPGPAAVSNINEPFALKSGRVIGGTACSSPITVQDVPKKEISEENTVELKTVDAEKQGDAHNKFKQKGILGDVVPQPLIPEKKRKIDEVKNVSSTVENKKKMKRTFSSVREDPQQQLQQQQQPSPPVFKYVEVTSDAPIVNLPVKKDPLRQDHAEDFINNSSGKINRNDTESNDIRSPSPKNSDVHYDSRNNSIVTQGLNSTNERESSQNECGDMAIGSRSEFVKVQSPINYQNTQSQGKKMIDNNPQHLQKQLHQNSSYGNSPLNKQHYHNHSSINSMTSNNIRQNQSPSRNPNSMNRSRSPPRNINNSMNRSRSPPRNINNNMNRNLSPPRNINSNMNRNRSPPRNSNNKMNRNRSPPRNFNSNINRNRSPPRNNNNNVNRNRSPPGIGNNTAIRNRSRSPPRNININMNRNRSPPRNSYGTAVNRGRSPTRNNFNNNGSRNRSPPRNNNNMNRNRSPPRLHNDVIHRSRSPMGSTGSYNRNQSPKKVSGYPSSNRRGDNSPVPMNTNRGRSPHNRNTNYSYNDKNRPANMNRQPYRSRSRSNNSRGSRSSSAVVDNRRRSSRSPPANTPNNNRGSFNRTQQYYPQRQQQGNRNSSSFNSLPRNNNNNNYSNRNNNENRRNQMNMGRNNSRIESSYPKRDNKLNENDNRNYDNLQRQRSSASNISSPRKSSKNKEGHHRHNKRDANVTSPGLYNDDDESNNQTSKNRSRDEAMQCNEQSSSFEGKKDVRIVEEYDECMVDYEED